jgi:UDP-N-acetylmuramyl pentapeptide phosphotransferase/UDP-N-acetylglucosamine-1-phosphate transferase
MAFGHPVIGTLTILFSVWIMARGLLARQGGKNAHKARRFHKRWAPWALGGMVLSGVTGMASTWWLRPDLSLGETWHLAVGWLSILLMGLTGLLTRSFTRRPSLRNVHPFIGIASIAAALFQGILGIELLP